MRLDIDGGAARRSRRASATPLGLAVEQAARGHPDRDQRQRSARRCGCRCSRRGSTRATSRCCPSAAPAGCTRRRSRPRWASREVVFPREPGTLSAYGILFGDIVQDLARVARAAGRARRACPRSPRCSASCGARRRRGWREDGVDGGAAALRGRRRHALPRPGLRAAGALGRAGARRRGRRSTRSSPRFHAMHRQRFSYADPGGAGRDRHPARSRRSACLPKPEDAPRRRPPPSAAAAQGAAPRLRRRGLARSRRSGTATRSRRRTASTGRRSSEEPFATALHRGRMDGARSAPAGALLAAREGVGAAAPCRSDPIEIEVIRNALTAAAAEMDVTVWRTSRSTIVRELLDYSTAVFDARRATTSRSRRASRATSTACAHAPARAAGPARRPGRVGAGGRGRHQRPLLRRAAPAGHPGLQAGVPRRAAHRLRRHALPPHRRGRPGGGQLRARRRSRSSRRACASRR